MSADMKCGGLFALNVSFCAIAVLIASDAWAGDLKITPSIALSEKYSDNVFLSDSGGESDWVTVINPGLDISYETTDIQLGVNYDYKQQLVKNNSDLDLVYQEVDVGFSAYRHSTFSFNGNAVIEQRPISYSGLTTSDIIVGDDFEEVKTGYVSPQLNLGNRDYRGQIQYVYSVARYERQPNASNDSQTVALSAGSGKNHGPLLFSAKLNKTNVDYVNTHGGSSSFSDAFAELIYQLGPKAQVSYGRGKESSINDRTSIEKEGYYWQAGFAYIPKSYLSLNLTRGEHYYGKSYGGAFHYNRAQILVDTEYQEETTSDAQSVLVTNGLDPVEPDFRSYLAVRNDILLTKTLTSRFQYRLRRLLLRYSNVGIHRSSQEVYSFERSYTHRFLASYQMPDNDSVRVMYEYIRLWRHPQESRANDGILSLNYLRKIGEELDLSLGVSKQIRSVAGGSTGYDELQFIARVEMRL